MGDGGEFMVGTVHGLVIISNSLDEWEYKYLVYWLRGAIIFGI